MIKDKIIKALERATGERKVCLEFPEREEFGDYSTNMALQQKDSRKSAEEVVKKLQKGNELAGVIEKIEVAGPGFINFWLSKEALLTNLQKILEQRQKYGSSSPGKGKTVVIDYSSPNIAKRFGIGHLRSTVIGQALYNLYSFLGYKLIGDNHLGDWGTQFGVLLFQITKHHLDPEKLTVEELEKLYVDFHKEEESIPELHEGAKLWFKKLEEGDKEAKKIWQALVDISNEEFDQIYQRLGVSIDYAYGESFYVDKMPEVIKEIQKKNLTRESEGAWIIEFKDMPPAILIKSDGTTTYLTRDLATIKYRLETWHPDIFIYEVGSDQTLYFRQLFEIVKLLDWVKDEQFIHVAHGLIRFAFGKMSTRRGQTIKLEDVLDEAIERAKKLGNAGEIAKEVGIGAIKYFDLSHQPTSDIVFDWEKIFVMEGNSGPYLQYTVARTNSVLAKIENNRRMENGNRGMKFNEEELSVLRSLSRFPEVIAIAAETYSPNLLCNYLFDLAQKFNGFYNKHRIIGSMNYELRTMLTEAVGLVLKNGLNLLGIQAPKRM